MFLGFSIWGWFNQVDHARRREHQLGDDGILPANLVDFVPSNPTNEPNDSLVGGEIVNRDLRLPSCGSLL